MSRKLIFSFGSSMDLAMDLTTLFKHSVIHFGVDINIFIVTSYSTVLTTKLIGTILVDGKTILVDG